MIGRMSVMDHTGHREVVWDSKDRLSVEAAERVFNELKSEGKLLYRAEPGSDDGQLLRRFDPTAQEIVVSPRNVGG